MNKDSRTAKSIKNSSVALAFYFVNLALQFFSRKIFLDYLGAEILGLNTTATNLLQFLNLAELGIGMAVGFSLYKPFYDKDTQAINEIVDLQRLLYRQIAYIVIAGAVVLMCFFPWIFVKMSLPLWYAYASFGVLLFSAMLSYFVNYKQILLSADQKEYKIQYSYGVVMLVKVLVQIFVIRYFENKYFWWLILEVLFAIIASCALNYTIHRTFPFISSSKLSLKELNKKYPIIQKKVKQLFIHRISGFVLTQTSTIIIYAFSSLTIVALYGNYMLVTLGLTRLVEALSKGQIASVGNLIAEGNDEKIMSVFEEVFSIRFFIAVVICYSMMLLTQPFILLWIGEEYLLPTSTLVFIIGILYINLSRQAVDTYIYANGFYSDIYAPIIESILNISLSILLGHFFGLNGILLGVLISLVIVILGWKPIFVFCINFKYGYRQYLKSYLKHLLLAGIVIFFSYQLQKQLLLETIESWNQFVLYGGICIISFTALLMFILCLFKCGIRTTLKRLKQNNLF